MDRDKIIKLLEDVSSGKLDVDAAFGELKELPFTDLGYARIDTHRDIRLGFPEVVFGQGKTVAQIIGIAGKMLERHERLLITRVDAQNAEDVMKEVKVLQYDEAARVLYARPEKIKISGNGKIVVMSAGTADIPVAREASLSAEVMGNEVVEIFDVGVSGIHRLFEYRPLFESASVVIVVAGMEGALASVIGGLVAAPVLAVPTSVGYGASLNGIAALLAMLNSCAPAVAVVNIDNGFGAAAMASSINHLKY